MDMRRQQGLEPLVVERRWEWSGAPRLGPPHGGPSLPFGKKSTSEIN